MEKIKRSDTKFRARLIASASVLALGLAAPLAHAAPTLPSGHSVVAGSISINKPNTSTMNIVQSSEKAVVTWQDFSLSAGTSVTFQQPDSAAITLNRVIGPDSSTIRGNISANGQVWLINGNGILFGTASHIDVGGLLATTSDIKNADFLGGNYAFGIASNNPDATVTNRGSISIASGSSAVLSAAHVTNRGSIVANLGTVVLGGASGFAVDFDGDNLLSYAVTVPVQQAPNGPQGNPRTTLVTNSGTVEADGGKVLMTARAAREVVDNVINSTGIVEARTASNRNGEIVLDAGEGGTVNVSGTLDASGQNEGGTGGTVKLVADTITVKDGARLDVSGDAGGGTALIGGTRVPGGGTEPSAQTVTVGAAVITADATNNGSGGTVVITSSGQTGIAGSISARGGAESGSGGVVETSGNALQVGEGTHIDTSAPASAAGLWLVDPLDVVIDGPFAGALATSLPTTNVNITAQHDIMVNAPVIYGSANSLTLLAGNDLTFNASIQNAGLGGIALVAAGDVTLAPGGTIQASGPGDALVVAAGGNFVNQAGEDALNVSGGGRWLVFLSNPANNSAGGLSASPFYNRAFDFQTHSYAPVTSAGNRFVYALAPVLTVTADDKSKTYGTANPALTATITGALPGDTGPGVASGAPSLNTAAATSSGVGDYAITGTLGTLASDFNYGFKFVSGNLHIDPATLVASLTGTVEKIYDGTTSAILTAANYHLTGVISDDSVTLNIPAGGLYDDKNAGSGKTVSVSGLALLGADKNNYVLASTNISGAVGIIDAASLTASLTGSVKKTYDGNTTATLTAANYQLSGVISDDDVTLNNPSGGSYDNKNAGSGKTVSVGGLALLGADKNDYVLASSNISGTVGVIEAASLTASLTGQVEKTYDGSTTATLKAVNYQLSGEVSDDDVSLNNPAGGSYDNKNAGSGKTVSVGGLALLGADKNNYVLASSSISGTVGIIDAASLTASLTGSVEKTYDGSTTATLTAANYHLAGVVSEDSVSLNNPVNGNYDNKNAGSAKTVNVSGLALLGADKNNYVLASSSISGTVGIIDAASLTASLTGSVEKTYDGSTTATLTAANYHLAGVVSEDSVSLNNPVNGNYDNKNAGSAKTVNVSGLALLGADKNNYVLASSNISGAIGIIDAASLTASLTGSVEKTYDGTATATLKAVNYQLSGVVSGDDVVLNNPVSGSYDNKNAGSGKTVSVSGLALLGTGKSNYVLASSNASGAIGIIDKASLTASLTGTDQKPYDGTASAALTAANYNLAGAVSGDSVSLNNPASGLYDNANAGTGKTVSVSGVALLGADQGNYVLASSNISAAIGVITAAQIGNGAVVDLLGNSYTSGTGSPVESPPITSVVQLPPSVTGTAPQTFSDATSATSDTGEDVTPINTVEVKLGQSLSGAAGSVQSSMSVLIEGLLRQFTPPPGGTTAHGVPPSGQTYSSWGNEAFWQ